MTWFQSITPISEPYDVGLDEQGRALYVFNVNTVKRPSETFLEELISILKSAGVATLNVTVFASSSAKLPLDSDTTPPFLSIYETPGPAALGTHNALDQPAYVRPMAKFTAYGKTAKTARALARAAYYPMNRVRNMDVAP